MQKTASFDFPLREEKMLLFYVLYYSVSLPICQITLCRSHFLLWKRAMKHSPRTVQSVNIPIHTAIGPNPRTRIRKMQRLTRKVHMETMETIMENFTSPAALNP